MPEPYSISLLNDSFPPLIDGGIQEELPYVPQ